MGFSRQEYWNGLSFPSPVDLPEPGIKLRSPAQQADSLPSKSPEKTKVSQVQSQVCPIFCNLMDCSTPGFSVHQQLPELAQTHVLESVMPSNHLILCHPLLLLPSIRVFSNQSALHIRWPKDRSIGISPSNEYSELISFRLTGLISLLSRGLSRVFSNTTVQKRQFFGALPSSQSNSHIHT